MVNSDHLSRFPYVESCREGSAGEWNIIQFIPKNILVTRGGVSAAEGIPRGRIAVLLPDSTPTMVVEGRSNSEMTGNLLILIE